MAPSQQCPNYQLLVLGTPVNNYWTFEGLQHPQPVHIREWQCICSVFTAAVFRIAINTLGNQNAQLLSQRPIHQKRNVQLTTFWSKWRKKHVGVLVWSWITNICWGIYGDNHAHGTRKHFDKGLVTARQDLGHTVFLVVCTANATSCYRHIC